MGCWGGVAVSISYIKNLTAFTWRDFFLFVAGAPGGLAILNSTPQPVKQYLSNWLNELIKDYTEALRKFLWEPLFYFIGMFNVDFPILFFDTLSGILALLVMTTSALVSGQRESVVRLIQRSHSLSLDHEIENPDWWTNRLIYPGVWVFLGLFFWQIFYAIALHFNGGPFSVAFSFASWTMMISALRGISKSVEVPEKTLSTDRLYLGPIAVFVGIATIFAVVASYLGSFIPPEFESDETYSIALSIGLFFVSGFLLCLSIMSNWRSIPLMLIWVVGLLIVDRISLIF